MARALFFCLTIVAAFPLNAAVAAPISEDAPVTAEVAALARSIDIDPARDRARFMPDLIRVLYAQRLSVSSQPPILARTPPPTASAAPRVPVPLSADVWSRAIFRRPVDS